MGSLARLIDADQLWAASPTLRAVLACVEVPDSARPAIRTRFSAVADWGFARTETSGHVALGWNAPADVADACHWLIVSSSGNAAGPAMPLGGTRNAMLVAGRLLSPSLHLSGISRHLIVLVPAAAVPAELATGVPFETESGLGAVLARMVRTIEREAPALSPQDAAAAVAAVAQVLRAIRHGADGHVARRAGLTLWERIIDHLELHLDEADLRATAVARACGLSLRHLHRTFADEGESFGQTLRRMRFARALAMLAEGRATIGHIASVTGFNSADYFATAFRREFGCSPRAWREARR